MSKDIQEVTEVRLLDMVVVAAAELVEQVLVELHQTVVMVVLHIQFPQMLFPPLTEPLDRNQEDILLAAAEEALEVLQDQVVEVVQALGEQEIKMEVMLQAIRVVEGVEEDKTM